jgi:hypothetical protein
VIFSAEGSALLTKIARVGGQITKSRWVPNKRPGKESRGRESANVFDRVVYFFKSEELINPYEILSSFVTSTLWPNKG